MILSLKSAQKHADSAHIDEKVKNTVEKLLNDINDRGDEAIRDMSKKFDNYNPQEFRLSENEIEHCLAQVNKQDMDDIVFAHKQIEYFAQQQKSMFKDIEVETHPGILLGHKNIPVNSVGCYIPGGKYPFIASCFMSIVTAKVAGVKRIVACTPPSRYISSAPEICIAAITRG